MQEGSCLENYIIKVYYFVFITNEFMEELFNLICQCRASFRYCTGKINSNTTESYYIILHVFLCKISKKLPSGVKSTKFQQSKLKVK